MANEANNLGARDTQSSSGTSGSTTDQGTPSRRSLIDTVVHVLTNPRDFWANVGADSEPISAYYMRYLVPLALIPAVCGFLGPLIFGVYVPLLGRVRPAFFSSLVHQALGFGLSLAMVYVLAQIITRLAPKFGGTTTLPSAVRLVGYSMTPSYVAGVFMLIPSFLLGLVGFLLSLYSIFVLYLGIPHMTTVPEQRRLGFMGATFALAIVAVLVVALFLAPFAPV